MAIHKLLPFFKNSFSQVVDTSEKRGSAFGEGRMREIVWEGTGVEEEAKRQDVDEVENWEAWEEEEEADKGLEGGEKDEEGGRKEKMGRWEEKGSCE